jgi:hypothetical protein
VWGGGAGGGPRAPPTAGDHASKFLGNWIYESPLDLLGKASEFPADVWNMVDDKIVKPIPHVAEGTFTDPEGTRLRWTIAPEQRKLWSGGGDNHLNVYPSGELATWTEGVIASTANHTGFYPAMHVHISRAGRVDRVEGGGRTGDLFRMLVEHPKMRTAHFPSAPEAGYWYLSADGFATNPKFVRDLARLADGSANIANLAERNRAGVQHFSFSSPARTDADQAYAKGHGVPLEHTAHMHVHFSTVRWRLEDTGEWITIAERGNIKAFEDPEVRALAARYGDPALIFRYEWIPTVPGVNSPGDYTADYGRDPWGWISAEWERIKTGAYEHYADQYSLQAKP